MLVRLDPGQLDPYQRPLFQVEAGLDAGAGEPVGVRLPVTRFVAEIVDLDRNPDPRITGRQHHLLGPAVVEVEHRTQGLVPVLDGVDRRTQGGGVQGAGDRHRDGQRVRAVAGVEPVEEPEPLL